ncbi:TadE/TadG family type IV pilus assembly protein [Bosea caraganae]|uniref:TadE/TadG family type IV pilus assembly protein n=1 Tax=Bosea caraganae TaxID=2763117 RepID=UPI0011C01A13|nr:TadE/TadG family type IV pilus assembly protein [Bosea caraganae]
MLSPRRNRAALRRLCRRLRREPKGVAAIEFSFLALPMVAVYFGVSQVASGVMIDRKVTQLTRSLADLTSQAGSIPDTEMTNIFNAAQTVMAPYTNPDPAMSITSVVIDANRRVTVCWSESRNGGRSYDAGKSFPGLPEGLRIANTSVIVASASYEYDVVFKNPLNKTMTTISIGNAPVFMRPRIGQISGGIEQVARVKKGSGNTTTTTVCSG